MTAPSLLNDDDPDGILNDSSSPYDDTSELIVLDSSVLLSLELPPTIIYPPALDY